MEQSLWPRRSIRELESLTSGSSFLHMLTHRAGLTRRQSPVDPEIESSSGTLAGTGAVAASVKFEFKFRQGHME